MKFIDLFAGIGGIRQGFDHIGWECVFSSEWDKFSQQTYAANFGTIPEGDITQIDVASIPPFGALVAGFPCQSFSKAGLYWNGTKGFADATRGTLFFNIASIVEHHRPAVVFLENVPNLLAHDDGNTWRIIRHTMTELGYKVYREVLNAKDFGLPQTRSRVYIVCFKSDDVHGEDFENHFWFPTGPKTPTRLGELLETNVPSKYTLSDNMWAWLRSHRARNEASGKGFGYSLFDADSEYANTISARYYKDGAEILIRQEDRNPRKLTPREAARLQGFPDSFIIPVSDHQAYKQFGNSVAVPVIRSIATAILTHLTRLPES